MIIFNSAQLQPPRGIKALTEALSHENERRSLNRLVTFVLIDRLTGRQICPDGQK